MFFAFSFACLHPPRMRGQRDRARVPAAAAEASRAPATARSPKTSRLTARSERAPDTDHAPPLTARSENGIDPALVEQVRTIRDRALHAASESPESEVLLRPRRTTQPLDADRRLRVRRVRREPAASGAYALRTHQIRDMMSRIDENRQQAAELLNALASARRDEVDEREPDSHFVQEDVAVSTALRNSDSLQSRLRELTEALFGGIGAYRDQAAAYSSRLEDEVRFLRHELETARHDLEAALASFQEMRALARQNETVSLQVCASTANHRSWLSPAGHSTWTKHTRPLAWH